MTIGGSPEGMTALASSPKLVLWNNALVSALGSLSFEQAVASPDWWGRLVENAVGAHLLNHLPRTRDAVHYWRADRDEADFVVEQGADVWGLEVKSGRSRKAPGLTAFRRRYPDSRVLVVGGEGMPLETFFESPPEALFQR